jgi:hypothetical protein
VQMHSPLLDPSIPLSLSLSTFDNSLKPMCIPPYQTTPFLSL